MSSKMALKIWTGVQMALLKERLRNLPGKKQSLPLLPLYKLGYSWKLMQLAGWPRKRQRESLFREFLVVEPKSHSWEESSKNFTAYWKVVQCNLAELNAMFHISPALNASQSHFHPRTPGSPQHNEVVNLDWVPKGWVTTWCKVSFKMMNILTSGSWILMSHYNRITFHYLWSQTESKTHSSARCFRWWQHPRG